MNQYSIPAQLNGGAGPTANTTFFYNWPQDENDTLTGGSGGTNTVVFQDTSGQKNALALNDPPLTGESSIGGVGVSINSSPVSSTNITSMQTIGVYLLGTVDSVTMDFQEKPTVPDSGSVRDRE